MNPVSQETHSVYNPLVSIIIGNYNYEKFIAKAIDSALKQTYKNIEVIVVDDGSTDNSRKIISSYGDKVIPVFKENGGQPSNYNAGFESSHGDIICFLDSDDIFVKNKVDRIVSIFESYKDIEWCFHSLQLIDESDKLLGSTTTVNYKSGERDYRQILQKGKIPPHIPPCPTLCFTRKLLEKILPMPTTKKMPGSDHYLKFIAVAISKGFILAEDLTLQRIHGNNMGTLREDKLYMRAREYLFTGYWINKNFASLKKFADKLSSAGIALDWQSGKNDFENSQIIKEYFNSSSLAERLKIKFIAVYYYINNTILSKFK